MTTVRPTVDIGQLRITPLADRAALSDFECGETEIDRAVGKCCEWHARHRARVFCAHTDGDPSAHGFYCLAISASDSKYLSEEIRQSNDGRPFVPFVYLFYIGVRLTAQRQKIGTIMLINALERCRVVVANVGVYGVALNALNDGAYKLYERYGFRQHGDTKYPLMILPTRSLIELFPAEGQ